MQPYNVLVDNIPEAAFENRFAADIQITLELCERCRLAEIRFFQLFEKLQYKNINCIHVRVCLTIERTAYDKYSYPKCRQITVKKHMSP